MVNTGPCARVLAIIVVFGFFLAGIDAFSDRWPCATDRDSVCVTLRYPEERRGSKLHCLTQLSVGCSNSLDYFHTNENKLNGPLQRAILRKRDCSVKKCLVNYEGVKKELAHSCILLAVGFTYTRTF